MPFLHTFSSTGDNSGFTSEIWKSAKNHSKCVKNCWKSLVTISFGFWIPIVFILALKRPKNRIFGSKFWARRRQKCYRNPFLGHFETPKEYGSHCHRYVGKVKFFRVIWITKRCQKCFKSPPWTNIAFLAPFVIQMPRKNFTFPKYLWQCLPYSFGVSKGPNNGFL